LGAIEAVIRDHPEGMTTDEIAAAVGTSLPRRTWNHRLKLLVDAGRIAKRGERRWTRYYPADAAPEATVVAPEVELKDQASLFVPVSKTGADIQAYLRQPTGQRTPVGYDPSFLLDYEPNATAYLSRNEKERLLALGRVNDGGAPAGTYAKHVLSRLLIDLSWNSSRLEGNTYSLLDTKRLLETGEAAEGKGQLDAQMILNHKDAIEFLVGEADAIGFNRYTMLSLHAMLASNLLMDPTAEGRLRHIGVGIDQSVFYPLEVPQQIEEYFDVLLAKASAIRDPFEQAFFVMVQLPYLQPFDDVNKRVSRLAANIPLIRDNLCPLSFNDVPRKLYLDAILGIYELNRVDLFKDVFIWAYQRSSGRYSAVRQSLGEPDPFRLRYREPLREVVARVVRERLDQKQASRFIDEWSQAHIPSPDRLRFVEVAENELIALHEGNFARYKLRPSEFDAWKTVWERKDAKS